VGGKSIDLHKFPKLKGIFKCGIGRDNIPEKQAESKGISCGFPSPSTASIIHEETANFASHLVLQSLYADVGDFNSWSKTSRNSLLSKELLIVGNGNIGSRVAQKLSAFLSVSTFDLHNNSSALKEKIEKADCISLHLPLTENTKGMFDKEKLSWMKNGACLVNTARAGIVSEEALYIELKNGRIFASFDVFWQEPYNGKLLEIPNDRFGKSPHVASNCQEFLQATAENFRNFISSFQE
jgi:phosphoglycerate dehydrogenase-like enzyme